MRTAQEFNEKYSEYMDSEYAGLTIDYPSVIHYVDQVFQDLINIKGFKYAQIKTQFGLARVYTNLDEIIPFVGRIIHQELEEKINFILKVEFEVEKRIESLNISR
jgi:hypothetical protein